MLCAITKIDKKKTAKHYLNSSVSKRHIRITSTAVPSSLVVVPGFEIPFEGQLLHSARCPHLPAAEPKQYRRQRHLHRLPARAGSQSTHTES